MPWSSTADFKKSTTYKRLVSHYRKKGGKGPPSDKVRQFMAVVNSQISRGVSESKAIASGWAAIKRGK